MSRSPGSDSRSAPEVRRRRPAEVDAPVNNLDLTATILDLAGAPPCTAAGDCRALDGRSLRPLLSTASGPTGPAGRTPLPARRQPHLRRRSDRRAEQLLRRAAHQALRLRREAQPRQPRDRRLRPARVRALRPARRHPYQLVNPAVNPAETTRRRSRPARRRGSPPFATARGRRP